MIRVRSVVYANEYCRCQDATECPLSTLQGDLTAPKARSGRDWAYLKADFVRLVGSGRKATDELSAAKRGSQPFFERAEEEQLFAYWA